MLTSAVYTVVAMSIRKTGKRENQKINKKIFKLDWGEKTNRTVNAVAIVKTLDEIEKIDTCRIEIGVGSEKKLFFLENWR